MKRKNSIYFIIIIIVFLIILTVGFYYYKNTVNVLLIGDKTINHTVNTEYNDLGFKITLNKKVIDKKKYKVRVDNNVNYKKIGTYSVIYYIKYLNKNYILKRKVFIIDNIKPDIKISDDVIIKDYCTKKITNNFNYKVIDNYDGDITKKTTVKEDNNKFIISVKDSSNNDSSVSVLIKYTEKPKYKFLLNGDSEIYVPLGKKYNDKLAYYHDGCTDKSKDVTVNGKVDTNTVGDYTIQYTINNNTLKRTVHVYEPNYPNSKNTNSNKIIYLTFDDGPGYYTKNVLKVLDDYNIKATFFVTNQFKDYIYLLKEEYKKGHSIGVHTYTHSWDIYTNIETYLDDFNKMNDVIEENIGIRTKIFRFPGGSSNTISKNYKRGIVSEIAAKMTEDGYVYFDWNVDSNDASIASSEMIYNNVIEGVQSCNNCVILLHDIKSTTSESLNSILDTLTSKGFKFGTLSINSPIVHHGINN